MNRQEAKQLLPIIKAFSEEKVIQWLNDEGGWEDIPKNEDMDFEDIAGFAGSYRIKPSPTYRPFANAEECWQEMQKHQPVGWVKRDGMRDCISFSGVDFDLDYLFKNATFDDDSVFGVKEESEGV